MAGRPTWITKRRRKTWPWREPRSVCHKSLHFTPGFSLGAPGLKSGTEAEIFTAGYSSALHPPLSLRPFRIKGWLTCGWVHLSACWSTTRHLLVSGVEVEWIRCNVLCWSGSFNRVVVVTLGSWSLDECVEGAWAQATTYLRRNGANRSPIWGEAGKDPTQNYATKYVASHLDFCDFFFAHIFGEFLRSYWFWLINSSLFNISQTAITVSKRFLVHFASFVQNTQSEQPDPDAEALLLAPAFSCVPFRVCGALVRQQRQTGKLPSCVTGRTGEPSQTAAELIEKRRMEGRLVV